MQGPSLLPYVQIDFTLYRPPRPNRYRIRPSSCGIRLISLPKNYTAIQALSYPDVAARSPLPTTRLKGGRYGRY